MRRRIAASRARAAKVIDQLARDLKEEGHRGFSRSNLHYMRLFAQAWPKEEFVQQAVGQIPWGHVRSLLDKLKDPAIRLWYAERAAVKFMLELGGGLTFAGRHKRLEVGGDEFFIDLLFFHVDLLRYVVVEAPIGVSTYTVDRTTLTEELPPELEERLPSVEQLSAGLQRIADERAEELAAALDESHDSALPK